MLSNQNNAITNEGIFSSSIFILLSIHMFIILQEYSQCPLHLLLTDTHRPTDLSHQRHTHLWFTFVKLRLLLFMKIV